MIQDRFVFGQNQNISNICIDGLISAIHAINWSDFFRTENMNTKVEIFNNHFFNLLGEFVPLTQVKLETSSKPWFTEELNNKLKIRKELREKYKRKQLSLDRKTI